jgi:hypothetical protein
VLALGTAYSCLCARCAPCHSSPHYFFTRYCFILLVGCAYVCMYIRMYACMHVCMYARMYYVCMHVYVYVYMRKERCGKRGGQQRRLLHASLSFCFCTHTLVARTCGTRRWSSDASSTRLSFFFGPHTLVARTKETREAALVKTSYLPCQPAALTPLLSPYNIYTYIHIEIYIYTYTHRCTYMYIEGGRGAY